MSTTLTVTNREATGKKLKALRASGSIPAVLYGAGKETALLSVAKGEFEKILRDAGESTILTLDGDGANTDVLIQEVAFDPARGGVIHIDFYQVEKGKELTTHVPLTFTGEAPAEKLGGTLTKILHEVEVTCVPADLPSEILVDVSTLSELDAHITVGDLSIPSGVTLSVDPHDVVVTVIAVHEESEEEVVAPDMDAIEVEAKGKAPEEES